MKRVSLVLYLGILLASLALAYLTWVEKPKKPGEKGNGSPVQEGRHPRAYLRGQGSNRDLLEEEEPVFRGVLLVGGDRPDPEAPERRLGRRPFRVSP